MRSWKRRVWILSAVVLCPGPAACGLTTRRLLDSLPSVGPALGSHFPAGPSPRVGRESSTWREKLQVCKNQKLTHKFHLVKEMVSKGLHLLKDMELSGESTMGVKDCHVSLGRSILHLGRSVYKSVAGFPWRSAVPRLYCYREAHSTPANLLLLPIPTKSMPAASVLLSL